MRLLCSFLLSACFLLGESADWIWTARYVVTMDPARRVIDNGAVAIRRNGDVVALLPAVGKTDRRFHLRQALEIRRRVGEVGVRHGQGQ